MTYKIDCPIPVTFRETGYPRFAEEWIVSPPDGEPQSFRSHEQARLFCNTLRPQVTLRCKPLWKRTKTAQEAPMTDYDAPVKSGGLPHPHEVLDRVQKAMEENDHATVKEVMDQVHGMGYHLCVSGLHAHHKKRDTNSES